MEIPESTLARIVQQELDAKALLAPLLGTDAEARAAVIASLEPRPEDYAVAFSAGVAAAVQEHIESRWRDRPPPQDGRSELRLLSVLSERLHTDRRLPAGYRRMEGLVAPELIWHQARFSAPGERSGMTLDLITRLGDRFVWFPKPWQAVSED